ncbi:fluoride efflux transporter CrcB [Bacillus sp. NEB1478]|uniref:fluoride efflux transporter CrcB n=1 Tax=Bacillus sp. NEB1478 TaxID=3073816 RepID=UPI002873231D|nr:fluoride efflux transporter CrcB [Bacillus sp. NEB1478]WNB92770.1 fluoride efflux transporter CrcB [Bacillus sp. NEB1478]
MIAASAFVAAGGFLGAICRFSTTKWISKNWPSELPIATLLINIAGSFLLGIIIGSGINHSAVLFLGTGFMGAFTTFSTFKLENIQLHANRKRNVMIQYLVFSYMGGILFAFLGLTIGIKLL